ncbi:MAG: hypothetical protein JRG93_21315 [Deltaproteobacteria bacterium]|nr:hypothetical protein [Deltaproteobacteria bacterium]
MALVRKEVVVDAPMERVFAYVTEPSTLAELRGQSTVVEFVPNERAVHQSIGTIGSVWTYTLEPHDGGTALAIEVEYTIPIPVLGKLAEKLALSRDARDLEVALINVKETLEA